MERTARRKFLQKSALCLIGGAIAPQLITRDVTQSYGLDNLISRFALRPVQHDTGLVANTLQPMIGSVSSRFLSASNNVLFQQQGKESTLAAYEDRNGRLIPVVTLGQWEVEGILRMAQKITRKRETSTIAELTAMLLPQRRSRQHTSAKGRVSGEFTSPHGYFTGFGYCQIKNHCEGNYMTVQVKVLDRQRQPVEKLTFKSSVA